MELLNLLLALISLLCPLIPETRAQFPNGACTIEGSTCEITDDNLVGIVSDVSNVAECRQLCETNATSCAYFTYYGPSSFPFMDACVFYDSCSVLDECEDCYTESLGCYDFCAASVEGALGDNIISVLDDIKDDRLCSESCDYDELCRFYTYHRGNSTLYPSTCFLLSEIREPIRACNGDTCVSGTPNCEDSLCTFLEEGFALQSGILTIDDNTLVQTRNIDLLMLGSCPNPIIVAVGGGGGGGGSSSDGGGGSGFIEFSEVRGQASYARYSTYIGDAGEDTYVTDLAEDTTVVRAAKGNAGNLSDADAGGNGYSGGGAAGGNGGSNGDYGEASSSHAGGTGTGFDVASIPVKSFTLSPGDGGEANGNAGGGGGGLLIDDQGPNGASSSSYQAKGFGAGAGYTNYVALPGVIICDFKP